MRQLIKFVAVFTAGVAVVALTGCASIVNGTTQPVAVDTGLVKGAHCRLENGKGVWHVQSTPELVTVHRDFADLEVTCDKSGYANANRTVHSHTKGMAFGNIVFGGVIGAGVDMANGAAYDYPDTISVPMHRDGEKQAATKVTQAKKSEAKTKA